jgi:predicted O-methyltransferase YrrM
MSDQDSQMRTFAEQGNHKLMMKLTHYFSIYEKHLARFRGKPVRILEIGVYKGGSLDMWRNYFGSDTELVGIDIFQEALSLAGPKTEIVIADQSNRAELLRHFAHRPPFDIILDDGGHHMHQQINSFEVLFPLLSPNGVYLVEDVHTSYWSQFGGGLRKPNTFMEYAKNLTDYVNIDHFREQDGLGIDPDLKQSVARELVSCSFYDSIVVFEKGDKTPKHVIHYSGNGQMKDIGTMRQNS